ncbi:MAG: hypothetical protein ABII06_13620, partial [Pseudomonadota bacterium]
SKLGKELETFLRGKGWKPERFFYVLGHVGAGIMALEANQAPPQAAADLQAQKQAIVNNPHIPPDQKQAILVQIEQGIAQLQQTRQGSDIPSGEMELIKASKDVLLKGLEYAPEGKK